MSKRLPNRRQAGKRQALIAHRQQKREASKRRIDFLQVLFKPRFGPERRSHRRQFIPVFWMRMPNLDTCHVGYSNGRRYPAETPGKSPAAARKGGPHISSAGRLLDRCGSRATPAEGMRRWPRQEAIQRPRQR